jgi:serine/threonine protein kinase/Flp pilus assembly protein TadD
MGCMREKGAAAKCPHCGWREGSPPESPLQLPPRTVLNGCYLVGRALGQGGFGITYLAWDLNLEFKLAVKEYFPRDLCIRARDECTVQPLTQSVREGYESGRRKFLDEGRALASFRDHPGIVSTLAFFQENGTAYIVMSYIEGLTLKQYLAERGGKIDFKTALSMLMPVMDTLKEVHASGMLHRDISPDNIYVAQNGQVKLLDFGNARFAVSERSQSLDVVLKPGYAPEEQYRSRGKQGEWTDLYALSATLYRAITGKTPSPAPDRIAQDDLVAPGRLGLVIPSHAERALLKGLALRQEDRFQSVADFQKALVSGQDIDVTVPSRPSETKVVAGPGGPASAPRRPRLWTKVALGTFAAIAVAVAVWLIWKHLTKGQLKVTANVGSARIAIQGPSQSNCVTPCDINLHAGEYQVIGTKPGYRSVERHAKVAAGEDSSVNLTFETPKSQLKVRANVVAQVAIHGQNEANCVTPCDLNLPAGEYRVDGTRPGYGSAEQRLTLIAGQTDLVNLQLSQLSLGRTDGQRARIKLGELAYQNGGYDEAIYAFRKAISLDPSDAEAAQAHRLLCNVLPRKQEWAEASQECRTSIHLNPNDALAHSELGVVLGHLGEWNKTIAEERAALKIEPNNALAHFDLGVALEAKGNKHEALDEFRRAHELDPANPGITANYQKLVQEQN